MKTIFIPWVILGMALFYVLPANLSAQAGALDLSFDVDGKVMTDIGSNADYGYGTVVQPDGKIIVAGSSTDSASTSLVVLRYNEDGSLDSTFDSDGINLIAGNNEAFAVTLQSDGKIVLGGYRDSLFLVIRMNSDGSLDSTFDADGIATASLGVGFYMITDILIQPDGKIVGSGVWFNGSNAAFASARYNTDGTLDASFDFDGMVITDISPGDDEGWTNALQPDGKIVVGGFSQIASTVYFTAVRYNTDGSVDSTFDADGIVKTTSFGRSKGLGAAIQSDGKILLTGFGTPSGDVDFTTVRYNDDGSLDNTFDGDGIVITAVTTVDDFARDILIQPDGKIIVGGRTSSSASGNFAVLCYNSNGSLDTGFDLDGMATTDISGKMDAVNSLALQPDGKLVAAGFSIDAGDDNIVIARYYSTLSTSIAEPISATNPITVYPNPFTTQTTIQSATEFINATLTVTNSLGQMVALRENINGHEVRFDRQELPAGIYFIGLIQNSKVIAYQKIMISNN